MNILLTLDMGETAYALAGNRYLFQGREYSWATGLYNFRARWYDSATGRWISKDPIGISGGMNLYMFCNQAPVDESDPFGLKVVNNSPYPIWIKPEETFVGKDGKEYKTEDAYRLDPGAVWEYGQDGICIPALRPNEVFKTIGKFWFGVDLVVDKNGEISLLPYGETSKSRQERDGGWKGIDWLEGLHSQKRVGFIPNGASFGPPVLYPVVIDDPDMTWDQLFRMANPQKNHEAGQK